jgi:hypothetical protein
MNMKVLAKTVVSLLVLLGLTVPSFSQVNAKTPGVEKAEMGKAKNESMKGKTKVHKNTAKAKVDDARGPVRAVSAPKSAPAHHAAP